MVDGDEYVINGSKCFISNMGPDEGDFVTILAITDPAAGVKGFTAIVVDRDAPGFSLGRREEKMGIRAADVSELFFEDCRVPVSNTVGEPGRGRGHGDQGPRQPRALIYEAATTFDRGENVTKIAAIAKYYASETRRSGRRQGLQIHSGYGCMRDYPLERMYRDARIVPIYEGTSEVQKMIIAREAMK